jgi:hypothetical protein
MAGSLRFAFAAKSGGGGNVRFSVRRFSIVAEVRSPVVVIVSSAFRCVGFSILPVAPLHELVRNLPTRTVSADG